MNCAKLPLVFVAVCLALFSGIQCVRQLQAQSSTLKTPNNRSRSRSAFAEDIDKNVQSVTELDDSATQTSTSSSTAVYVTGSTLYHVPANPPWYLKNLSEQIINESLPAMQLNYSEFSSMLSDIDKVFHPFAAVFEHYSMSTKTLLYELVLTSEMESMASELNLCSQADVLRRISCRDRCGQSPDEETFPTQCSCDQDCFLYGDCCEDLNVYCADIFVQAILKYHDQLNNSTLASCSRFGKAIAFELFKSEQTDPSIEPKTVGVDCRLYVRKDDAVDNILDALDNSACQYRNLEPGLTRQTRSCGRPDVLMCEHSDKSDMIDFYPLHLLCLGNSATQPLVRRYLSFQDMEVISQRGSCSYLRHTPDPILAYSQNNYDAPSNLWHKEPHYKMKLTIVILAQKAFFNFEARTWDKVRCTGGSDYNDWSCEKNECQDNQFFDDTYKTCYWPDFASLQVITLPDRIPALPDIQTGRSDNIIQDGSVASPKDKPGDQKEQDTTSTRIESTVQLCSCLKAQSVVNSVGRWQTSVDTRALLDDRCEMNLDPNNFSPFVKGRSSGNETKSLNASLSDYLGLNPRSRNSRFDSSTSSGDENITSLSLRLETLWTSRKNECKEEEVQEEVRICLSLTKFAKLTPKCFVLQRVSAGTIETSRFDASRNNFDTHFRSLNIPHLLLGMTLIVLLIEQ